MLYVFRFIADVDECQLGLSSSPCNALSEYCVNSVGSYICIPMEGSTGRFYTCVGRCTDNHTSRSSQQRSSLTIRGNVHVTQLAAVGASGESLESRCSVGRPSLRQAV